MRERIRCWLITVAVVITAPTSHAGDPAGADAAAAGLGAGVGFAANPKPLVRRRIVDSETNRVRIIGGNAFKSGRPKNKRFLRGRRRIFGAIDFYSAKNIQKPLAARKLLM